MKHRKVWAIILMLAAIAMSIPACGAPAPPAAPAPKAPTKFVTAIVSEPGSLDPGRPGGAGVVWFYMFNDLVSWSSKESKFVPGLAEKWENIDPLTWKFTLRKGVKFHDGSPMTSADVQYTFYRIMGRYDSSFMGAGGPAFKALIDTIETPDEQTAVFRTKYPESSLASMVHYVFIVPKAYIEKVGDDGFAKKPVGTGPYKFKERVIGESVTLQAFREYFNTNPGQGELGSPTVDIAVYRFIPEEQSRINALMTGEVDAIQDLSKDNAKQLESSPKVKVYYTELNQPSFVVMNCRVEKDPQTGEPNPFTDLRVRQAMNHALDLDALIKSYGTGREYRTTMLGKDGIGYNPDVPFYKYDPAKARQLLAEAGYPNGFSAKWFVLAPAPMYEAMQKYWKDVGIDVQFQSTTVAVAYGQLSSKKLYGIVIWSGNYGPDPAPQFLDQWIMYSGTWAVHPQDAAMEKLILQAKSEFDVQKRAKLLDQVTQMIWKNAWFVPLWENVTSKAIRAEWDYDHQPMISSVFYPALRGKK